MEKELLELYKEVLEEVKENDSMQDVKAVRKKLETKIGNDKDVYLVYKSACAVESPIGYVEAVFSMSAVIIALLSLFCNFIGEVKWQFGIAIVVCILLNIVMLVHLLTVLGNASKSRIVSNVLEEIYKEKFENKADTGA